MGVFPLIHGARAQARLRRSNFGRIWVKACAKAGVPGVHFHDLRHTGGTLAAATGASLKELMARLGHSSTRAALIYQHATRGPRPRPLQWRLATSPATSTGPRMIKPKEAHEKA